MNHNSRNKDMRFACAIIAVHVLFFLLACHYTRIYMGDSFEYVYEALNIKKYFFFYSGNASLPIVPEYMTQRQPVYPLFLLSVYLFSVNNWIVLVLQNLLSVFNILYLRKTIERIGYNKKYDPLLLLLLIAYPAQFINANTIAPDILLQTFTLLYFGSFISLLQSKDRKYMIQMSLSLIAGLMVKPVLYPFVLVHIVILIVVSAQQKIMLQRTIVIALIPLCAVFFYNYWNYTRTGKFHFSSNQSFNAIFYFAGYFSQRDGADSGNEFLKKERRNIASIPDYEERYDYANERGIDLLKQNFAPYMVYHLKNSARIFIEPGKAEMDLFTGRLTYGRLYSKSQTGFYATLNEKGLSGLKEYICNNPSLPLALLVFIFNCVRLVGLFIFLFSKRFSTIIKLFVGVLLVYFAVAAGPIANTRYFLPVSLIAIGCAVLGYQGVFKKKLSVSNP